MSPSRSDHRGEGRHKARSVVQGPARDSHRFATQHDQSLPGGRLGLLVTRTVPKGWCSSSASTAT